MPLARKQIRNNAHAFVKEWQDESREHAEAKSFWEAFFQIFGVNRRRVASFEEPVKKADTGTGFIDLLWKGKLLIEHKSRGKDLDKAYSQALNYFPGLKDEELPRYVLVSDFARFRLYDLDAKACFEFTLEELPDKVHLFDFVAGYEDVGDKIEEYDLNIQAAEKLGRLHDALQQSGYSGHELEVFLVRVLFCLFGEDTGIFNRHQFINYLINFTRDDGTDTEMHISKLFQVMDKEETERNQNLSEELNAFPYVNGHLFAERIDMPSFTAEMREMLIECAYFDWGSISPAIFGSLFQSVMDKEARRNMGAHYTSEKNILRLIKPLFLDELYARFENIQTMKQVNKKQQALIDLQREVSTLVFLDPACGCGNFLIITYRELRRLELRVLKEQQKDDPHFESTLTIDPLISLDHFHGIEIEEWPVRIGEVAMWLTQHQMNREFAKQFGREPDLLPLKTAAHIVHDNALQIDWHDVVAKENLNYIIGNPPFVGKNFRSKEQNEDMVNIFSQVKNYKSLDFVTCWFHKASDFIQGTNIKVAFVSTNSITQGEQVAPMWQPLLDKGIHIHFAHRTFAWDSEARGKAAVHVVIIGFALTESNQKFIFDYSDIKSEPLKVSANNINPYLVDAPDVVVANRTKPLCKVSEMVYGNKPVDGGHLLLTPEEKDALLNIEPQAEKWLRPILGAEEFINNKQRWCLWLIDIKPNELRQIPEVLKHVEAVKQFRLASTKKQTQGLASEAIRFAEIRQPEKDYILVPCHTSENREYIPLGFFAKDIISHNSNLTIPQATQYEFGLLQSKIHMAWMRTVGGRLESRYRYSAKLVYNNFPWPEVDKEQKQKIETAAQAVLDARLNYPDSSLADLYDPLTMPADLRKAHTQLDKVVDQSYRKEAFKDDAERLQFLFNEYARLTKALV